MTNDIRDGGRQISNTMDEQEAWQRRRQERARRMRMEKEKQLRRQRMIKQLLPIACGAVLVVVIVILLGFSIKGIARNRAEKENQDSFMESGTSADSFRDVSTGNPNEDIPNSGISYGLNANVVSSTGANGAVTDGNAPACPNILLPADGIPAAHTVNTTNAPPASVDSKNVVFIDLNSGEILAQRGYKEQVSPASRTKVLALLVAVEHITNLDDTFTITIDITDYAYINDCSSVGFEVGEVVTVRDLLYGMILPSGGDAAVGLATYVAGSHEAFVDMMNEKLSDLGLAGTAHFTNCVGIYDKNHYCSMYDMAMIMEAATQNELCREVMAARFYTTSSTTQHPEGITISNLFIRRIEDKDTGGTILGAKTGYVNQSGSCAVSYGVDAAGNGYVCASAGAGSAWKCIYDHVALYKTYAKEKQ